MSKSRASDRGFLLACAWAALVVMTVAPAANATNIGSNLGVQSIGLSMASTTLAYVQFTGSMQNDCTVPPGSPGANRMFFDHTTTKGKAIMSLLTAAQLAGKKVSVMGNGACITQQVEPFAPAMVTESIVWLKIE